MYSWARRWSHGDWILRFWQKREKGITVYPLLDCLVMQIQKIWKKICKFWLYEESLERCINFFQFVKFTGYNWRAWTSIELAPLSCLQYRRFFEFLFQKPIQLALQRNLLWYLVFCYFERSSWSSNEFGHGQSQMRTLHCQTRNHFQWLLREDAQSGDYCIASVDLCNSWQNVGGILLCLQQGTLRAEEKGGKTVF